MDYKGRVLLRTKVSIYDHTAGGGAEKLMRNLSSALVESGWGVDVLSPYSESTQPPVDDGINYQHFNYSNPTNAATRLLNSVRGARTFKRLIEETDYDVILDDISHLPFYPGHFLKNDETENAIFLHGAPIDLAKTYDGLLKGTVVEYVDRTLPYLWNPEIICAGPENENRIHSELGYYNTHVLNPCIDIDQYDAEFSRNSKYFLSLGRLTPRKNVQSLLKAWLTIETVHPEYRLIVAGSGRSEEDLKRQAENLGLSNVEFAGFVDEQKKIELYEQAYAFVLPSLFEGYATTGLEAFAAGTPVIGSDTTGVRDYIVPDENGFLFEKDNPKSLAEKILYAIDHPNELQEMSKNGRALAEEHSYSEFRARADEIFTKIKNGEQ